MDTLFFWVLIPSFIVIAIFLFYSIVLSGRKRGNAAGARSEAIRLGLLVEEVIRECPFFLSRNELEMFQHEKCVKYSLRREKEVNCSWEFLQRTEKEGAQFPAGMLYVLKKGSVPEFFNGVLTRVAKIFVKELFEFEGTSSMVSVYWMEWGGARQTKLIYKYLQELSRSDHEDSAAF